MGSFKRQLKHLTVVRVIGGFLVFLIAVGRLEHKLFFGRRQPKIKPVTKPAWLWLIKLGWRVERLALAGWSGPRRLLLAALSIFLLVVRAPLAVKTLSAKTKQTFKKLKPQPSLAFLKPVAAFACLLAFLIVPLKFYGSWLSLNSLKNQIVSTATAALGDALSAKQAVEQKDFFEANRRFSQASANFVAADAELKKVNGFLLTLAGLIPNSQTRLAGSGQAILEAASLGSGVASDLSLAMNSLFGANRSQDMVVSLAEFSQFGAAAKTKADQLNQALEKIDGQALPEAYQEEFAYFKDQIKFMAANLGELVDMADKLRVFLGEAYDKRYLLVYQNNTEARATGGFMGSYAVVDFSRGRIKNLETPGGGTYDTEAGLRRAIQSPEPMKLIKPRWYMWDANWWPDWPTSARKIMWFYEQSGGSTVDGVISLTPEVIIDLLKVAGPVKLDGEFMVTVTADNFMDTVQAFAEQKTGQTKTPKQIIGVLADKLLAKIIDSPDQKTWLKLVSIMEQALNEKQILLYFSDDSMAEKVAELGWDGRLKDTNGDYLSVVNTNIGGSKSDKKIKQTIELTTNILSDGSLVNHLKIIREHQGRPGEEFYGVANKDWLRIYVPLGSKLLEAEGFKSPEAAKFQKADPAWELDPDLVNEREAETDPQSQTLTYREQDKTVFANWSLIGAGEVAVIKLSYKLPFKLEARPTNQTWLDKIRQALAADSGTQVYRHSLLAQKQAGAVNSEINYKLAVPSFYEQIWQYPDGSPADYLPQTTDKYWGYILKDKK